ncbi:MAG: 50S ribosomal protein L6 [Clostridia bacterium]|nr:50S ribosomal protein L6 [Clostridia bacterium]
MSRIGKMPITIPAGVDFKLEGNKVTVKGPNGTLTRELHKDMIIKNENGVVTVERPTENKEHRALHGLTRTLIANMVIGVTEGYTKTLEINGVGYRAAMKGKTLDLTLGFSHPVEMEPVEGITIEVPQPNTIIVKGADKQLVGHIASLIREKRPPEPYKGKGIKYSDEVIRRKEGKTGAKKK